VKQQKKLAKKMLLKIDKMFGHIDYNKNGGKKTPIKWTNPNQLIQMALWSS
jgi:hypothetical protein